TARPTRAISSAGPYRLRVWDGYWDWEICSNKPESPVSSHKQLRWNGSHFFGQVCIPVSPLTATIPLQSKSHLFVAHIFLLRSWMCAAGMLCALKRCLHVFRVSPWFQSLPTVKTMGSISLQGPSALATRRPGYLRTVTSGLCGDSGGDCDDDRCI